MEQADIITEEGFKGFRLKKFFVVLMSIFLLLIVLVYFLTGNIFGIVSGLIESSNLEGDRISMFNGVDLIFVNGSYEVLMGVYNENLGQEFRLVCLDILKGIIMLKVFLFQK